VAFQRYEFDEISRAEAEAIGQPGQRRFRMIFGSELDAVVLWLEKQQLQALGLAFEQVIAQLRAAGVAAADVPVVSPGPAGPIPPGTPEFQIGRLAVGYDEENSRIVLIIHDIEAGEEDAPNFVGRLPLHLAAAMAAQIDEVVKAGRPLCPRCHQPINPEGHVCPHDNGHFPHLVGA
jgi:uncharacterized repeat protein (TIGR03847 family)